MNECLNISKSDNNLNLDNNISESDALYNAEIKSGYIIFFINPLTGKPIYLARGADISSICYDEYPKLPGTANINLSKLYNSIDEAKKDIYMLRYHHRDFLKVITCVKKVSQLSRKFSYDLQQITSYNFDQLKLIDNIPLENNAD